MLGVLTCLRAWCVYVLACLRAWRAYVLRAYVLGVLTCLRAYVLGMFTCLRACVLTCLVCLRVYVRACYDEMFYFLTCLCTWRAFLSCLLCILILKFKNSHSKKLCALLS